MAVEVEELRVAAEEELRVAVEVEELRVAAEDELRVAAEEELRAAEEELRETEGTAVREVPLATACRVAEDATLPPRVAAAVEAAERAEEAATRVFWLP